MARATRSPQRIALAVRPKNATPGIYASSLGHLYARDQQPTTTGDASSLESPFRPEPTSGLLFSFYYNWTRSPMITDPLISERRAHQPGVAQAREFGTMSF